MLHASSPGRFAFSRAGPWTSRRASILFRFAGSKGIKGSTFCDLVLKYRRRKKFLYLSMNMAPQRRKRSHSSRDRTEANTALVWSILGGSELEPEQAPYRTRAAIGYPRVYVYVYMILSSCCIMWNMAFVAAFTGGCWHECYVPPTMISRQPNAKTHVPVNVNVKVYEARHTSIVTRRASEIFLSAVPTFAIQSDKRGCHRHRHRHRLHKSVWNKKGIAFAASASLMATTSNDNTDPELRSRLTTMLESGHHGPLSLLGEDSSLVIAVIADTGCTMASSFDPLDFEGPIIPIYPVTRMQGIVETATVEIRGRGTVQWTVIDDSGSSRVIRTPGYYVPGMHVRLLSPQAYLRDPASACEEFRLSAHAAIFSWSSHGSMSMNDSDSDSDSDSDGDLRVHTLTIPYDNVTALPCMRAYRNRNLTDSAETGAAGAARFFSGTDAYLHSVEVLDRLADRAACTSTSNTPACAGATPLDEEQEDWRASWMHAWRSR